ncbi:unnamed protein product [Fraxinus pennsylvanica]|uniref:Uncharacterized protein n=1 Tax=Fraxinus pennsylvanica TaxID=56036 RepID=A0AAD2DTW9_9LAMI|nr:unnamed protein product [Fraxinus pennsylvanica]
MPFVRLSVYVSELICKRGTDHMTNADYHQMLLRLQWKPQLWRFGVFCLQPASTGNPDGQEILELDNVPDLFKLNFFILTRRLYFRCGARRSTCTVIVLSWEERVTLPCVDLIDLITGRNVGVGSGGGGVTAEKVIRKRMIDKAPPWRNGVERERERDLNWRIGGKVRDLFGRRDKRRK